MTERVAETNVHALINRERRNAAPEGFRWQMLKTYRQYARGIQKGTLNADQVRILQAVLQNKFADNILQKILTEHANRSRVARFDVEDEAVSEFLFMLWVKNQFPDLYAKAIYATLRDGNHALLIDWIPSDDPGDVWGGWVKISRERWWNGTDGMFVAYDDDGSPSYAVKEWKELDGTWRKTIYYPSAIHRYRVSGGTWELFNLPEDFGVLEDFGLTSPSPVPWVKADGQSPLGLPVIHLANGSDDDTMYGVSLLAGGVLAFQDQLNAIQHDITAAAMLNGSPQTYSKGFTLPDNPDTGKPIVPKTGPGAHHHTDEATAEWGTIQPGSLQELTRGYDTKLRAVCRNTNTPLHVITGEWPSGEALFRADLPLVHDTKTLAASIGPSLSTVMHRATEVYNTFGTGIELDEDALIQSIFDDPEMRDELSRWTIAEKAAPFVSEREILRLVGYEPSRIEEIMEEREEEAQARQDRAMLTFDRGPSLVPTAAE